jgi:hypothetical protein
VAVDLVETGGRLLFSENSPAPTTASVAELRPRIFLLQRAARHPTPLYRPRLAAEIDPDHARADPSLIDDGALVPWSGRRLVGLHGP